jgi:hypothetical protein
MSMQFLQGKILFYDKYFARMGCHALIIPKKYSLVSFIFVAFIHALIIFSVFKCQISSHDSVTVEPA